MNYLSTGFWKFDHDCKLDQLKDPNHTHIILQAMGDHETQIDRHTDGTYTIYGGQEALLITPRSLTLRLMLLFYSVINPTGPAYAL